MAELQPGTTMYRIAELERVTREQRQEIRELRGALDIAEKRIGQLERSTPQARQLQYEADVAGADALEYEGRHGPGCDCPYCGTDEPKPAEYDPGPEVDDEGGMSEYRHAVLPAEEDRR